MTREELEKLENNDIYWLAFVYLMVFLFGPFGLPILAIAWIWSFVRHGKRQEIVDKYLEQDNPIPFKDQGSPE